MTQRAGDRRDPVARVYDRVAHVYDLYDAPMDWLGGARRRRRVLSRASGQVMEVGIGTARNAEHYPSGITLVGVDVSAGMLRRAHRRSVPRGNIDLVRGDVQHLPYRDAAFDTSPRRACSAPWPTQSPVCERCDEW